MTRLYTYRFYYPEQEHIEEHKSTVSYPVEESLQDIIEYYFEERYHKKYNPYLWLFEAEATVFIKNIEDQWQHNQINLTTLYDTNTNFKNWLKQKYQDQATALALKNEEANNCCMEDIGEYNYYDNSYRKFV